MRRLLAATLMLVSVQAWGAAEPEDICYTGSRFAECAALWDQNRYVEISDVRVLMKATYFQGYVDGAFQTLATHGLICPSAGVTHAQAWAVTAKYLHENPDKWNDNPDNLVRLALSNAFPCKPPAAQINRKK